MQLSQNHQTQNGRDFDVSRLFDDKMDIALVVVRLYTVLDGRV